MELQGRKEEEPPVRQSCQRRSESRDELLSSSRTLVDGRRDGWTDRELQKWKMHAARSTTAHV